MKTLILKMQVFALIVFLFSACKKDENKVFFLGGKSPVVGANKSNVVLTPATQNDEAITFKWTNPDYQFSTGISSHDVRYEIEMDVSATFNTASKRAFNSDMVRRLSKTFTVGELNNFLGNTMQVPLDQNVRIYARIVSYIADQQNQVRTGVLYSNTVFFDTKPYSPPPAVEPPSSNRLVAVGSATPGGWDNNASNTQVFTRVSNTLYEITIQLTGGGSILFLPVAGSWDDKYGWDGANNANNPVGDKLKRGGGDIKVPATSGNYKIVVNFQSGVFTITPA